MFSALNDFLNILKVYWLIMQSLKPKLRKGPDKNISHPAHQLDRARKVSKEHELRYCVRVQQKLPPAKRNECNSPVPRRKLLSEMTQQCV